MLKKVSDNIINLLIMFNYSDVDEDKLMECVFDKGVDKISELVILDEEYHQKIDRKLLDNLEDAIDEINVDGVEFDFIDLNMRLNETKTNKKLK